MIRTFLPEIAPVLPDQISQDLLEAELESGHLLNLLSDQQHTPQGRELRGFIFEACDCIGADNPNNDPNPSRAFEQGMLFATAVAISWLEPDEWSSIVEAQNNVIGDIYRSYSDDKDAADANEQPFSEFLLEYGIAALEVVQNFRHLAETWAGRVLLSDIRLYDYFISGAGLMIQVAVAMHHEKHLERGHKLLADFMEQLSELPDTQS